MDSLCEFVNILQQMSSKAVLWTAFVSLLPITAVLEGCFVDSLCEFVNILQRMFSKAVLWKAFVSLLPTTAVLEGCFVESLCEFVAYNGCSRKLFCGQLL